MSDSFIPLRIHSEYSIVNGLHQVSQWIEAAKKLGYSSLALTDETNLFATIKFYQAAKKAGIKPIFGSDLWLKDGKNVYRFTLLCLNKIGFKNLTLLISRAYLEGERHSGIPYIKKSWLSEAALQNLVMLSGGMEGECGRLLLKDVQQAKESLAFWQSILPDDRFYLEISRTGAKDEELYVQKTLALAEEFTVPVIATHPALFLTAEDFAAHEVRVATHDGYTLEDLNRPQRFTPEQYLLSPDQMQQRFKDCSVALENAVELAYRCNVEFELGKVYLPNFPIPAGLTEGEYFRNTARAGLQERLLLILKNLPREEHAEKIKFYEDRLELELDVIIKMGFSGYFLIVADFIQWAKNNMIPVGPGRGSGAGSIVAYALKITDIDPIPYDLLFERFLNPERVSMPDFDIDFCMDGRDRVIEYVADKYGRHSVSQIITFGSMAAKAVVRDVGRVLGLPYGFVDGIAKLIPLDLGMTLPIALQQEPQLKKRYEEEEDVKSLIDMGLKLEGTVRNVGKHAGGVVIAPSNLTDFAPVYCEEGTEQLVVQYDKDDAEAVGLIKFDFLGLRNLTIIQAAVEIIKQKTPFDINLIPLNDRITFDLLKRGETSAVFQLESRGMKDLIKRLKPDTFEDIIALVALFRPGPLQSGMVDDFIARKHGHAPIEYPHPDTAPILKSTYGIILYQEQVMLIPQVLAGYTLGGADLLRRAMGKKKAEEMAQQRSVFMQGALKNNISTEVSGAIFDLMEKFAGYGFNKSHSAAYALVAYQTAYLKAHYPSAFLAAVLSSDMDNTDKVVSFVIEARAMRLKLLHPDVQESEYAFNAVDEQTIRYGLGAIKGVGRAAIDYLITERKNKPFEDLFDFCRRMDLRKVNKRALEALIYSGALDTLGPSRSTLLASLETAMQSADQQNHAENAGQDDFFNLLEADSDKAKESIQKHWKYAEEWSVYDRVMFEKQVLGWCLSGHPLEEYRGLFKALRIKALSSLSPTGRGETICIAGIVTDLRRIKTKRGSILTILTLEDSSGRIDVTCYAEVGDQYRNLMKIENILVVECEVSFDDFSGGLRAVAKALHNLHDYKASQAKLLKIKLSETETTEARLIALKEILRQSPGNCPIELLYEREDAEVCLSLGKEWSVSPDTELLAALAEFYPEIVF